MLRFFGRQPRWVQISIAAVSGAVIFVAGITGQVLSGTPRVVVLLGGALFVVLSTVLAAAQAHTTEASSRFRIDVQTTDDTPNIGAHITPLQIVTQWLDAEREICLQSVRPPSSPKRVALPKPDSSAMPLQGIVASLAAAGKFPNIFDESLPEDRTKEDYLGQVEDYLSRCQLALFHYFGQKYTETGIGVLQIFASNPTDVPWHAVSLELFIPGKVLVLDPSDKSRLTKLPNRPRPFGERRERPPIYGFPPSPKIPPAPLPHLGPRIDVVDDGVVVAFQHFDLRPREVTYPLSELHLLLIGELGTAFNINWEATATDGHGRETGSIHVIANRPVDTSHILLDMEGDLNYVAPSNVN